MKGNTGKKKNILVLIGIIAIITVLSVGFYWLSGEYQYYKHMYEKGKVAGEVFEDCEHTVKYGIDQSTSMATREPIALSAKKLQEIHPTAWGYMWCCGQVQDEVLIWSICSGVAVIYTVTVALIGRKKKQSVL